MELTMPALNLLFLATVFSLGTAFVWMFWEVERHARAAREANRRSRLR